MHNQRFLSAEDFSRWCKELNISLEGSELEFYEQAHLIMPVAWVLMPTAYAEYVNNRRFSNTDEAEPPEWEPLDHLLHPPFDEKTTWDDDMRLHRFDRASELNNPYLRHTDPASVGPWEDFDIGHYGKHSYRYSVGVASPYYHSWQAYQVYLVQRTLERQVHWTSLLMRYLESGKPDEIEIPLRLSANGRWTRTFQQWLKYFDALSFYAAVVENEEIRTFEAGPLIAGVRHIEGQEFQDYEQRIVTHAKETVDRYQLEPSQLLQFMVDMLNLHNEMQEAERGKLSDALTEDLRHLREMIRYVTDKTVEEIEDEIGRLGGWWIKKSFRHLHPATELVDDAKEWLNSAREDYNKLFPSMSVSEQELKKLVQFMLEEGLFVIPYTVSTMENAYNDTKAFIQIATYIGMKNLATGVEDLLRAIALRRPGKTKPLNTLEPVLNAVFPATWINNWKNERTRLSTLTPKGPADFAKVLDAAAKDSVLAKRPDLRIFLILYWARNLTGHYLSLDNDLYFSDLCREILQAIFDSLLYSWAYARSQKWV